MSPPFTRPINPPGLAKPSGYSHGIVSGGGAMLHVAGQVGWDADGNIVGPGFAEQFDQALANVLAVVEAAGGVPSGVTRMRIFVADLDAYRTSLRQVGERYRERMGRHFPAMALVKVELLEEGALVEIEADAVVPE